RYPFFSKPVASRCGDSYDRDIHNSRDDCSERPFTPRNHKYDIGLPIEKIADGLEQAMNPGYAHIVERSRLATHLACDNLRFLSYRYVRSPRGQYPNSASTSPRLVALRLYNNQSIARKVFNLRLLSDEGSNSLDLGTAQTTYDGSTSSS